MTPRRAVFLSAAFLLGMAAGVFAVCVVFFVYSPVIQPSKSAVDMLTKTFLVFGVLPAVVGAPMFGMTCDDDLWEAGR